MSQPSPNPIAPPWSRDLTGPATLAQVMEGVEHEAGSGAYMRPLPTGFSPLDEILNGGLRAGELLVFGGAMGAGKTIFGLQTARNAVCRDQDTAALYVCYEHDREHLMMRLLCMESAERGYGENALTMRKLASWAYEETNGAGLISTLRRMGQYTALVQAVETYSDRLVLVKASGHHSTLDQIKEWVREVANSGVKRVLLVVDYLQKVPVNWSTLQPETEVTTHLTQGLKEMAMSTGIRAIAIAASDRAGLKAKRMRLADLRGSSALQYEADVGLILSNKYSIVSREHLIYNPVEAQGMRDWVVMSIEKNRAGRNAVDMEFRLDAAHFRIVPTGNFVRERLVDEKVILA
jgi:replicative DNA helicase